MFLNESVDLAVLKKRAYNLRWASVEDGIIPLTAADPDFPCAPEIVEAISSFTKSRYFSYGPSEGLPSFRESITTFFQTKRNVPQNPDFVLPVDSAAFGIYVICKAFLNREDEAIIFDPVDFLFRYSVENVGGVAVPFAIPPGSTAVDFSRLESLITPKTKMICLCNPLNPTGKVFTKEELLLLGNLACKHDLIILSDEIWSDIIFKPFVFTSIASLSEDIRNRTITVTGFSKSYGLAGLRIGAIMAYHSDHFSKLFAASLHQSTIHGANIIGQLAATTALNECGYWLDEFVSHLHKMKEFVVSEINNIPTFHCIAPDGCYVAFVDITKTQKSSLEIKEFLSKEGKVEVVPGLKKWFGDGAEGYIRISFATSHEILTEAMNRIKKVMM